MRRLGICAALAAVAVAMPLATSPAVAKTKQLQADLNGADEVPGPGDPNASGVAVVQTKTKAGKEKGRICVFLATSLVDPKAAHIHKGEPGEDGQILVPIFESTLMQPIFDDCWKERASLLKAIRANVTYVNVHTHQFPGGAIRGQLLFTPSD